MQRAHFKIILIQRALHLKQPMNHSKFLTSGKMYPFVVQQDPVNDRTNHLNINPRQVLDYSTYNRARQQANHKERKRENVRKIKLMNIFPIWKQKRKKRFCIRWISTKNNPTSISIVSFFTFMYFITWPTDQRRKYLIMDTPRWDDSVHKK